MKLIGENGTCTGCGALADDPDCDCEWTTCSCGANGIWVRPNGTHHCWNCDRDTDWRAYYW